MNVETICKSRDNGQIKKSFKSSYWYRLQIKIVGICYTDSDAIIEILNGNNTDVIQSGELLHYLLN